MIAMGCHGIVIMPDDKSRVTNLGGRASPRAVDALTHVDAERPSVLECAGLANAGSRGRDPSRVSGAFSISIGGPHEIAQPTREWPILGFLYQSMADGVLANVRPFRVIRVT